MEEQTYSNEDIKQELETVDNRTEIKSFYNDVIVFEEIPEYDTQDYDLFDEKDFKKYINDIEKIVRQSFEYRQFVNYLREYMDMNKCSFLPNVTNSETFKIKIHLHHCPFTLYDIVMTIFNKRMFYGESLEVEMVAKEVMYIHYFLMVGIIPLSETVHELVHSQVIDIPIDHVMGNYSEFVEMYREFIPEDAMEKFNKMQEKALSYNDYDAKHLLEINPTAIQISNDDGNDNLDIPMMQNIVAAMNNRIDEIKNNNYCLPSDETSRAFSYF